ncbi:MAG: flippase-like domain-containing protein [Anaerolineaceae bacterium]|nr:flippase-like domain-containing protein [Anaerolineaceae bacterium]
MLKKSNGIIRRMLPGVFLGFAVFVIVAIAGDISEVSSRLNSFNWNMFYVAMGFTLFNYILRFFKWHYYISCMGIKNFPIMESLQLFVAGFPLAMTPGKVGEIFKGVWLRSKTGLPVSRGLSIVVAERISDGMAVLLLSTLGVIAYPQYWPAFLTVFIILVTVIVISQIRPAAYWLLSIADKIPLVNRVSPGIRDFYEGSFILFKPVPTLIAVGLGTISWLGEGIGFYFILLGLGLPSGINTLTMAIFILAFSTVIGAVSTLPGGLGAAELSIAGMLKILLGVSTVISTTATLLIRLATLWFGMILGLIVWLFSPKLLKFSLEDEQKKLNEL